MKNKESILSLILDKENFALIKSGEKKEDYRGYNDFYCTRLCNIEGNSLMSMKHFDLVKFNLGYTDKFMLFKCDGVNLDEFVDFIPSGFEKGDIAFTISIGDLVDSNV